MPCEPPQFDLADAAVARLACGLRNRKFRAAALLSVGCLSIPGCARLQDLHMPAANQCTATIAVIGAEKACPVAAINFQMAVSGCRRSTGTFDYDFKAVTEARKMTVSKSGSWTQTQNAWRQTESVPLGCDAEIDDIGNARITNCICQDR